MFPSSAPRLYTPRPHFLSSPRFPADGGQAWAGPAKTNRDPRTRLSPLATFTATSMILSPFCSTRADRSQNHWAGSKALFVQTGDLIDRGPKPREVMDLMMALEKEAPKQVDEW